MTSLLISPNAAFPIQMFLSLLSANVKMNTWEQRAVCSTPPFVQGQHVSSAFKHKNWKSNSFSSHPCNLKVIWSKIFRKQIHCCVNTSKILYQYCIDAFWRALTLSWAKEIWLTTHWVLISLTNTFHVVMHLFSNWSDMITKRGRNRRVAQPSFLLTHLRSSVVRYWHYWTD